jgi:hypothetical protein
MKKLFKITIVGVVLLLFSAINVQAEDSVTITKVSCSNMYGGVLNNNLSATTSGLNIKVDDSHFINTGDYTKCVLEITNNSKDVVAVDSKSISNLSNDNISYELTSEGDNSIAISKSATYDLNINYRKEYTEDKVLDNVVEIKLSGNTPASNPSTLTPLYITLGIILIIVMATVIVVIVNKNGIKTMLILLIVLSIVGIPTVKALTQVTIKVENKIIIEYPEYHVYYQYDLDFIDSTTLSQYDTTKTICNKDSAGNYITYEYEPAPANATSYKTEGYAMESVTEYYSCSTLVKDLGKYKVGSQVSLVSQERLHLSNCVASSTGYTCSSKASYELGNWIYIKLTNYDNDKTTMNFTNGLSYDNWDEYGVFHFNTPNSFTMPDHEVTFVEERKMA